ncbi:MAG TPA: glycosyltransferase family 39 protein, partial [Pyrinomonadaceae bacterium]|nr:glycosyltransferase family 39 protein [Pyrinomonadaceae bacterium]
DFTKGGEGSGSGMVYLVAAVYGVIGRNMLAIQLINSIVGAATAPLIFLIANRIFNNVRVARFAAIAVAFYPSLVLWSSQGLKDGPIVFFLALAILATLRLGEKLSAKYIVALGASMLAVLSLRFYVFYILCVAIAGAFVIGIQAVTARSFTRQFVAMLLLALGMTYFGVSRSVSLQFEQYGDLRQIQRIRADAATSAESGFGEQADVSTSSGALSTIPLGLVYLLFAPFPWQMASLRQSITLPEMVVWWASVPLLILGLWFSLKYRLRMVAPIVIFTAMLSLSYAVFQGNVGTAYRQRAQLLVFYFIFAAVGLVLVLEKREDKKRRQALEAQQIPTRRVMPLGVTGTNPEQELS